MNKNDKCNNNKCDAVSCEYYVPMGKVGGLVIQAPVILSNLKVTIPLSETIDLNQPDLNFKTLKNKVFLMHPKLTKENKLFLKGYIDKLLIYSENLKFNLKISFKELIPIDFNQFPIYKKYDNEYCYIKKNEPISFNIDFIKIYDDVVEYKTTKYVSSLKLIIQLSLIQIQNVFIPEPEGDVKLLPSNLQPVVQSNLSNIDFYYTLGYNPDIGLIANKTISDTKKEN